ncbi:hypothetical protein FXB41_28770 [Bradyrhizobium canariense]|uniref:hypothetical protein n=1 Tax=Bradyrhizobium canariense TaxID=255045 RepID=UPI001CA48690|nr:hypothetical protein [Bradyrhizobium canariense]MBW5438612.1 hypothetical protein [Bradyrhizobium canariense]
MSFTVSRATMARVSKDVLRRDIVRRYKAHGRARKQTGKNRSPIANLRLVELERIFRDRFGKFIPANEAGNAALQVLADGFVLAGGNGAARFAGFVSARAPWASSSVEDILNASATCSRWQSADQIAWRIQLSAADRSRLRVRTIGAVGITARQRKGAARARKIKLQAAKREASGATPRAKSLVKTEPWTEAGISRATWYRRLEKSSETISVPISILDITRTEIVSPERLQPAGEPQARRRAMESGTRFVGIYLPRAVLKHSAAARRPSPSASALVSFIDPPSAEFGAKLEGAR